MKESMHEELILSMLGNTKAGLSLKVMVSLLPKNVDVFEFKDTVDKYRQKTMATYSINAHYKGTAGENEVARILSGFNRQRYIVLNNILLRKPYVRSGEVPTVQIDHIVVSVYGIFIIETKNYSGKIYGYEESKGWSVYLGGQKYPMQNPLRQNHSHSKT